MAIESVGESQARQLVQKKKELEQAENEIALAAGRAKREGLKLSQSLKEKTDQELVQISKAGEKQVEAARKLNSDMIRNINENNQANYMKVAATTAEEIKRIETDATKAIADHRTGQMEKLAFVTSQSEDPFYRLKSLNPVMSEGEKEFLVKLALPEHEAKNLFVSGEGQSLKLSLARRFQEKSVNAESAVTTKTNSYQTIVESLALPGAYDPKGIKREYAEGVVTITVPKIMPLPPLPEAPAGNA